MTPDEVLKVADESVMQAGKELSDLHRTILREVCEGKKYGEVQSHHSYGHIKDAASELWKLLSEALGERVTKSNFQGVLEKRLKSGSIAPKPPILSTYNEQIWVGRERLINDDLLPKLQDQTRLLWIRGISGIGKSTLGGCLASKAWESDPSFQWIYLEILEGQSPYFPSVAADLLAKLGDRDLDPQERNDPKRLGDRLLRKLQNNRYWVQLDSLERLINPDQPTEFADTYWQIFLQHCLNSEVFPSRLVLTAQVLPKLMKQLGDRKFWHQHTLEGLSVSESLNLFEKYDIADAVDDKNESILSQIGQAYEGHPLVLQVIAGEISSESEKFKGDVVKYWERYSDEFAQVARALAVKRVDPFDYSQELKDLVRDRVEASLKRLAPNTLNLLCRSAVYRRAVPQIFWQAMLWDCTTTQQAEAYSQLRNRALIEKENTVKGQDIIRQHNLIRDIAYDLLRQDSIVWETAERKAAELWITLYEPTLDVPNLEKVRGYLEAFHHYCNIENWREAERISLSSFNFSKFPLYQQLDIWGYFREEIQLCKRLLEKSSPELDVCFYHAIGIAYSQLGNQPKAIDFHHKSLSIAREKKDQQKEAANLMHIGISYWHQHKYPEANQYFEQALTMAHKLGDSILTNRILLNQKNNCADQGEPQQAIDFCKKYLDSICAGKLNDQEGEGIARLHLGARQAELKQWTDAQANLEIALQIFEKNNYPVYKANALHNLAILHQETGSINQAKQYCDRALALAIELGIPLAEECQALKNKLESAG